MELIKHTFQSFLVSFLTCFLASLLSFPLAPLLPYSLASFLCLLSYLVACLLPSFLPPSHPSSLPPFPCSLLHSSFWKSFHSLACHSNSLPIPQERQGEGLTEIPTTISTLYVNIIQNIMGNPPDLTVLKAVCEFLIAMHPTEDTTRLHSPNRFYLREHSFDFGM